MRFKGGTATIRSKGFMPYDGYLLRVLPGGRWRWVEITSFEDLDLIRDRVSPNLQRVPYCDLRPRFQAVQKRQGTPLSVKAFLEQEVNE